MQSTKETITVLNDLIQINNHWITGYEQAIKELKVADAEMKLLFQKLIEENRQDSMDLRNEVKVYDAGIEWSTTVSAKIYKTWVDIKAIFKGSDKTAVLKAVEKAYQTALASENLPANLREMIKNQKSILRTSQDEIIASRNQKD